MVIVEPVVHLLQTGDDTPLVVVVEQDTGRYEVVVPDERPCARTGHGRRQGRWDGLD